MRFGSITTAVLAACLVLPASAAAAYDKPSGTFCDSAGECLTVSESDTYTQRVTSWALSNRWGWWQPSQNKYTVHAGSACSYSYNSLALWEQYGSSMASNVCVLVGGDVVDHSFTRLRFDDIPEQDRDNFRPLRVDYTEYLSNGNQISDLPPYTQVNLTQTSLAGYCDFYRSTSASNVAIDRTPDSVFGACSFARRASDPAPVAPPPPPSTTLPIPTEAARCGAVRPPAGTVVVRSVRARCDASRTIMARYARTLRSPDGWTCMAVVRDTGLRARCVRLSRASSVVWGIWVR